MEKRTSLALFVDWFYVWCKTTKFCINTAKETRKRIKIIGGGYQGSKEEFQKVIDYWKKYGIKPKKYWYQLYGDTVKEYDPRYISDPLWFGKILPYYNNLLFMRAYTDKGMLDRLVTGVKTPENAVKNIAGTFYTNDNQVITEDEAVACCLKEDVLIFKPSVDSGTGRLIQFFESATMGEDVIRKYFNQYKGNFVAQKIVKQHADLAAIHPKSLNTIRVISFRFHGETHILSAQLRMGAGDARIDNYSAGGIACAIKDDGWLADEAITKKYTWTDCHPSGRKFNTIQVPCFEKVLDKIRELHPQLPYYNIIGWDFAVDEAGEPVLIEFNVTPGQNECGSRKPSFGDLTDQVLDDVFLKHELEGKMN